MRLRKTVNVCPHISCFTSVMHFQETGFGHRAPFYLVYAFAKRTEFKCHLLLRYITQKHHFNVSIEAASSSTACLILVFCYG